MSTRNPAAARSSSDSAPQKPYSRCSRAQSRHPRTTGHALHTERACPSRSTRASGRSPAGAKNNSLRPWQDASAVHARGPLKIKLEMVSTAAKAEPPLWPFEKETPGSRWGATDPPSRPEPILTAGLESVQQLGSMEPINLSDGHTATKRGKAMELRHLDTLLAIAEQGSFTAAADVLSTVQSNGSGQVPHPEGE